MTVSTPIGAITLVDEDGALTQASFGDKLPQGVSERETPLLIRAKRELTEYFDGKRQSFDLPLAPKGTDFQRRCWDALQTIPYGETVSYGEEAERLGNPKACRAVGMANNRNPICVIIPCHRVIGKNGALIGYAAGLEVKKELLELEASAKGRSKA